MPQKPAQHPTVKAFREYCAEQGITPYEALGIENDRSMQLRKVLSVIREEFPNLSQSELARLLEATIQITL